MTENNYDLLPSDLFSVTQVRAIDRFLIEQCQIPGLLLMKKAGAAAFRLLLERWPRVRRIVVFCGAGNNSGDGYVIAQQALLANLDVEVVSLVAIDKLQGDARTVAEEWLAIGGEVRGLGDFNSLDIGVVVDALLGTGLDRQVEGEFAEAVNIINAMNLPVLAIDIPSGINGDTGKMMGCAVQADVTTTFIAMKQGLLTGDAPEYCGELIHVPLANYPHDQLPSAIRMTPQYSHLPRRKRTAHKGDFGHAVLMGGDLGYSGAIRLSAEATARMGAGLISVITHPEHAAMINHRQPEIMCRGADKALDAQPLLAKADAVGIGPGLGQGAWGRTMFQLVRNLNIPTVMDADALNFLSKTPAPQLNWILTPHPGEAARLLGCSVSQIEEDRFAAIRQLQCFYGGVVVLKGAGTLIYDGKDLVICDRGNPGMASGGMGDVLTGVITACLAQGMGLMQAACFGVWAHASAADVAAKHFGERGLLAGDLITHLKDVSDAN